MDLGVIVGQGTCWSCPDLTTRNLEHVRDGKGCSYNLINWETKKFDPVGLSRMDGFEDALRDVLKERPWELDAMVRVAAYMVSEKDSHQMEAYVNYWDIIQHQPSISPILRMYLWGVFLDTISNDKPPSAQGFWTDLHSLQQFFM